MTLSGSRDQGVRDMDWRHALGHEKGKLVSVDSLDQQEGSWGCRAGGGKGIDKAPQGRGEGGSRQILHITSLPRAWLLLGSQAATSSPTSSKKIINSCFGKINSEISVPLDCSEEKWGWNGLFDSSIWQRIQKLTWILASWHTYWHSCALVKYNCVILGKLHDISTPLLGGLNEEIHA